ncbi:MAG: hypothetical protein UC961_06230 [Emergencia sp.]|nr:hypothetical protein [Emergencia sp.]
MKRVPLEGKTFGKWKVLSYEGCVGGKKSFYQCRCMGCGQIYSIRADRLTCGRTNRCLQCRIAEDCAYGRKLKQKTDKLFSL